MDVAPICQQEVNEVLDVVRKRMASSFGITLVQDANGSYGRAGKTYLTLRLYYEKRFYEVAFTLSQISCHEYNIEKDQAENEDK